MKFNKCKANSNTSDMSDRTKFMAFNTKCSFIVIMEAIFLFLKSNVEQEYVLCVTYVTSNDDLAAVAVF